MTKILKWQFDSRHMEQLLTASGLRKSPRASGPFSYRAGGQLGRLGSALRPSVGPEAAAPLPGSVVRLAQPTLDIGPQGGCGPERRVEASPPNCYPHCCISAEKDDSRGLCGCKLWTTGYGSALDSHSPCPDRQTRFPPAQHPQPSLFSPGSACENQAGCAQCNLPRQAAEEGPGPWVSTEEPSQRRLGEG